MTEKTGYINFSYKGEVFQTWYKIFGDLNEGGRPLILLHGGPAIPSPYLYPHIDLYSEKRIPLIFYDQIGCGKSTHLREKPASFFTFDLFMDELDNVLTSLGVAGNFDLYGHSCGGMLAADYVASRQPKGLNRLILSNTTASTPLFITSTQKLLNQMSPGLAQTVQRHEIEGTMDALEYQDAAKLFLEKHICSMEPTPRDLQDALEAFEQDKTVFNALWGPYEFKVSGSLESWSVIDKLHSITAPTLVMNGVSDEMQDECIVPFVERIAKVKWVKMNSGHMPFYEEKERYFQVVGDFLRP